MSGLPVGPQSLGDYVIGLITWMLLWDLCAGNAALVYIRVPVEWSHSLPWEPDPEISCSTKPCFGLLTCRCTYNGLYSNDTPPTHTHRIRFCWSALGLYTGRHLIPADLEFPHAVMSRSLAAVKCKSSLSLSDKIPGLFHAVCPGCLCFK